MFLVAGLLAAALAAPFGPIALRRWALARAQQDPVAAWFGFSIRLHALTMIAFAIAVLSALFWSETRPWFERTFPAFLATPLRFVVGLLPAALLHASATLVAHDLSRTLRNVDTPRRVAVELAVLGAAMILIPFTMLASSMSVFDSWGFEAGVATALASIVVLLGLGVRAQKLQGLTLHSITTGELRDQVFAIAERAGVRLEQVYALPLSRWKHANAFATEGRQVLVTDYLLDHLDRDEVDAVMAHEVAHLAGKDPERQAQLLAAGVGAGLMLAIAQAPPFVTLAGIVVALLVWLGYSRRCEYGADARAQRFGAVPRSAITGLAKLNRLGSVPIDYPVLVEWWLTHPSTARRARAIGRLAGMPADEVARLLTLPAPATAPARYEAPVLTPEGQQFSTTFKRSVIARNSMLAILIGVTASLAFVNLARSLGIEGPWRFLFWPVAASFVAGTVLVVFDRLATDRFRNVARAAFERLAINPTACIADGVPVGFAPHEAPRLYEFFSVWDVGRLDLTDDRMDYRGERLRFSLAREQVVEVRVAPGVPGWIAVERVLIRWRRADGAGGVFALSPSTVPALSRVRLETRALHDRIRRWWSKPVAAWKPPAPSLGDPPTAEVTGQLPGAEITSQGLSSLAILYAILTTLIGFVARMPWGFSWEAGLLDALVIAWLGHFILLVPTLHARARGEKPAPRESESDASRAA